MIFKSILFSILFFFEIFPIFAQIEVGYYDYNKEWNRNQVMFFTNRTLKENKDGSITFKNHTTKQNNYLYFCRYNFEKDSIEVNSQMINKSTHYPDTTIEHNVLYDFYEHQRIDHGIKNFYFVVGGYGKTFNKQVSSYMQRLKSYYGDTLFTKASIIVFAWGDEDHAYRYWNGVRAARRGAADFSIFQHMLDEFVSDSAYFRTHPKDYTFSILFSSMGNYLFKDYIEERQSLNIPLIKTYHKIVLVGSVTPRNCFEKGESFADLYKMADSVDLYVNHKDALLWMSSIMHLGGRIGRKGPKDLSKVPDFVNIINVDSLIVLEDLPGLGHDYLLTNPTVKSNIINKINTNIESKNKGKAEEK